MGVDHGTLDGSVEAVSASPRSQSRSTSDRSATCAVIIPTHDRPDQLGRCLAALAALTDPPDRWEVVVVDDGTPGGVAQITDTWARADVPLRLITQQNAGPAAARNKGAAATDATYVVFTDDDCEPQPEWLVELLRCLEAHPGDLVGGPTVPADDDSWLTASELIVDFFRSPTRGPTRLLPSNNLACAADRFRSIGGFDTSFPAAAGEDREFSQRWADRTGTLRLCTDAVVAHGRPLDGRSFWRQHMGYGRGAVQFRRRSTTAAPAAGIRVVVALILHPFRSELVESDRIRRVGLSARVALSQIAVVAGVLAEQRRPSTPLSSADALDRNTQT